MYKRIILALLLIDSIVCDDPVPVCTTENIEPCRCYPKSSQIRCELPLEGKPLDNERLKQIGSKINGVWKYLYIHETPITEILAGTFQNATFEKIFIENNNKLASIPIDAFGPSTITQVIEIRNNAIVDAAPLFDLAIKFEKKLRIFSLEGNKIKVIPKNKLVSGKFEELQIVNLNDQKGVGAEALQNIPAGTVVNLKNLAQLSLDKNKIATIDIGAIVLTESQPTTKHISIFLNDNQLSAEQLTIDRILLPKDANTEIGLVLERNQIKTLPLNDLIIKSALKGHVYLGENDIKGCTCEKAKPLTEVMKSQEKRNSIQGISAIDCGGKPFETCIPPSTR